MKRFGLIGVAGYIAPRHLEAIKQQNGRLIACYDVVDSVGIIDRFFPDAEFFTNFEEFAAFIEDEQAADRQIDYISICSPNHLHLSHIKYALRRGINVICEKPLVLDPGHLDVVARLEETHHARVSSILQLRLHPSIVEMQREVVAAPEGKFFHVELTYITARGKWYGQSWKGDVAKSGGVAMNIGIHLFDMLSFVFGAHKSTEVYFRDAQTISGRSYYGAAEVNWFLSTREECLPENAVHGEKSTYRNIAIDGSEFEFSEGFTDLHTESYRHVINSEGFGAEESRGALEVVNYVSKAAITEPDSRYHSFIRGIQGNVSIYS